MAQTKLTKILESMPTWEVRDAAKKLLACAEENGAYAEPGDVGFSIRFPIGPGWQYPISVAWLYPGENGWSKARYFSFGKRTQGSGPESLPEGVRNVLEDWVRSLDELPYTDHCSAKNVDVWVVNHANAIEHIDELSLCLESVLLMLKKIHSEDLEDFKMAEEVMERVRKGEEKIYSSEEVGAHLGLDS